MGNEAREREHLVRFPASVGDYAVVCGLVRYECMSPVSFREFQVALGVARHPATLLRFGKRWVTCHSHSAAHMKPTASGR